MWRILNLRSWKKSCSITPKATMELIEKAGQFTLRGLGKLIRVGLCVSLQLIDTWSTMSKSLKERYRRNFLLVPLQQRDVSVLQQRYWMCKAWYVDFYFGKPLANWNWSVTEKKFSTILLSFWVWKFRFASCFACTFKSSIRSGFQFLCFISV